VKEATGSGVSIFFLWYHRETHHYICQVKEVTNVGFSLKLPPKNYAPVKNIDR
jgi:hypothetical protein